MIGPTAPSSTISHRPITRRIDGNSMSKTYIAAAVIAALIGGYWWASQPPAETKPQASGVAAPVLTSEGESGRRAYEKSCVACHGVNGAGTEHGPPLIHKFYEPSHHGDASFLLAARNGVRAHHWRFGDMPPVQGVTDEDVSIIVVYVREVQRANGIF